MASEGISLTFANCIKEFLTIFVLLSTKSKYARVILAVYRALYYALYLAFFIEVIKAV